MIKPNKMTAEEYTSRTWDETWTGRKGSPQVMSRLMQVAFKGSQDANGAWVRKFGGHDLCDPKPMHYQNARN